MSSNLKLCNPNDNNAKNPNFICDYDKGLYVPKKKCNPKKEEAADPDYICNELTGRWIKKDGKVGLKYMARYHKQAVIPPKKVQTPKKLQSSPTVPQQHATPVLKSHQGDPNYIYNTQTKQFIKKKDCNPSKKEAKDPNYICNEETGRWVKKTGAAGERYLRVYKKTSAAILPPKPVEQPLKPVQQKPKQSKKLSLGTFLGKTDIDLGKLGKYSITYSPSENVPILKLLKKGKIVTIKKDSLKPKAIDFQEGDTVETDQIHVGDILNFGTYRFSDAYIVSVDKDHHQYLLHSPSESDGSVDIPTEVSDLFTNPVKAYDDIDNIGAVKMKFPNGFLESQYGLTKNLGVPKDIVFEYTHFADQLDIQKPNGKYFTVESKQKGSKLLEYILENIEPPAKKQTPKGVVEPPPPPKQQKKQLIPFKGLFPSKTTIAMLKDEIKKCNLDISKVSLKLKKDYESFIKKKIQQLKPKPVPVDYDDGDESDIESPAPVVVQKPKSPQQKKVTPKKITQEPVPSEEPMTKEQIREAIKKCLGIE